MNIKVNKLDADKEEEEINMDEKSEKKEEQIIL